MRDRGFMLLFGGISALLYVSVRVHADDLCDAARRGRRADGLVPVRLQRPERADVGDRPAARDDRPGQRGVERLPVDPHRRRRCWSAACSAACWRRRIPIRRVRILFLVGAAIMAVVALYALWKPREVFDNVRVENGTRPSSDRGSEAAGAALADLSGAADLAAVEFRAGLDHAAAVSSSEHPARHRRPMGRVERHLRRLLHSDLHRVRHCSAESFL